MQEQSVQLGLGQVSMKKLEALANPKTTSDGALAGFMTGSALAGQQQSDEVTSIVPYLQGIDQSEVQKIVKSMLGAENEPDAPDFAVPLMTLGLSLMSQPGDFVQALGKAGLQALPQFQAEKKGYEQAKAKQSSDIRNMTNQLILQDAGQARDLAITRNAEGRAKTNRREEMAIDYVMDIRKKHIAAGILKPKDRYTISNGQVIDFLAKGGPKSIRTLPTKPVTMKPKDRYLSMGGNLIDLQELAKTNDASKSIVMSVDDSQKPTADSSNFDQLTQLAARTRAETDPNKKAVLQEQVAQFSNMIGAVEKQGSVTSMTVSEDGVPTFIQGTPDAIEKVGAIAVGKKQAAEYKAGYSAARGSIDLTTELLARLDRNALSFGKAGDLAGTFAGVDAALRDVMGADGNAEFQSLVKGSTEQYLTDVSGSKLLTQSERDGIQSLSNQSQEIQSLGLRLAMATAKAADPGGRVSDKDLAAAITQLGLGNERFFSDPERIRTGLITNLNAVIKQSDIDFELINSKDDASNPLRTYATKQGYKPIDRRGNYKWGGETVEERKPPEQQPIDIKPADTVRVQQATSYYQQAEANGRGGEYLQALSQKYPVLAKQLQAQIEASRQQ